MATTMKLDDIRCLMGPSCSCPGVQSVHPNSGWRLKLKKSLGNLLCPNFDISSEMSTIGSTIKLDEVGPDGYLYLDPSEKEVGGNQHGGYAGD